MSKWRLIGYRIVLGVSVPLLALVISELIVGK